MIHAPWTPEQCEKLNEFQDCGWMHPFTCGECEGGVVLEASPDGWHCPNRCGWRQTWAHEFMVEGSPPDPRLLLGHAR